MIWVFARSLCNKAGFPMEGLIHADPTILIEYEETPHQALLTIFIWLECFLMFELLFYFSSSLSSSVISILELIRADPTVLFECDETPHQALQSILTW